MPDATAILPSWADLQANPLLRANAVTAINQRVLCSYTAMSNWDVITQMIDNFWLYLLGRRSGGTRFKYRMNKIQGVCIANAAIQVGDRPQVKIGPRESGEKPVCFVNTRLGIPATAFLSQQSPGRSPGTVEQLFSQLRPQTYQSGQGAMHVPLNDAETILVQQAVQESEALRTQARAMGMPEPVDILPEDFLIEVNDYTVSEALQTIFDIKAEQASFYAYIVENVLYNNIFGMQYLIVEFDDETLGSDGHRINQFYFKNAEAPTVHLDPYRTNIRASQWVVYDEFLEADEAITLYPHLKGAINTNAVLGPPVLPGVVPYQTPLPWFQAFQGARMVIIRNAWLRNQPFPLTPEEALKAGLVMNVPAAMAPPEVSPEVPARPGLMARIKAGAAKLFGGGDAPTADNPDPGTGTQSAAADDSGGGTGDAEPAEGAGERPDMGVESGSGETPPPVAAMRDAYFLADETGAPDMETGEINAAHPAWPVRRSIRQMRIIAGSLEDDRECERVNIPVGHNKNIPIPFTPYGQGEPERLEPLQRAYNQTLSDNVEHGSAIAKPPQVALASIVKNHPELIKTGFAGASNRVFPIDDKQAVAAGGIQKTMGFIESPPLPADNWKREEMLDQRFDKASDQSEILQGNTPNQQALSGKAVSDLQTAAKSSINFKGGTTEDMIKYVVGVMIGDISFRMTPEELAEEVKKYPVQVWYEIHRRMQDHCLEADITVTVASNSTETTELNNILTAAGVIPDVASRSTIQERLGLDPDVESNNTIKDARRQAMAQGQMPQQPQPGAVAPTPKSSTPPAPPAV